MRLKMVKYAMYPRQVLDATTTCDLRCAEHCFASPQYAGAGLHPLKVFLECLLPQCHCAELSTKPPKESKKNQKNLTQIVANQTQFIVKSIDAQLASLYNSTNSITSESVNALANNSNSETKHHYSIVNDCNRQCHADCIELKKFVPVAVLMQCARSKCNCKYELSRPVTE